MLSIFKHKLLKELLYILSKCRKKYISGEKLVYFGISLRFLVNDKLEIMLFSNFIDVDLYNFRQSILIEIQKGVLKGYVVANEKLIQYESTFHLRMYMQRYLCKGVFIDTRSIFFEYIVITVDIEVYNLICNESEVYIL